MPPHVWWQRSDGYLTWTKVFGFYGVATSGPPGFLYVLQSGPFVQILGAGPEICIPLASVSRSFFSGVSGGKF